MFVVMFTFYFIFFFFVFMLSFLLNLKLQKLNWIWTIGFFLFYCYCCCCCRCRCRCRVPNMYFLKKFNCIEGLCQCHIHYWLESVSNRRSSGVSLNAIELLVKSIQFNSLLNSIQLEINWIGIWKCLFFSLSLVIEWKSKINFLFKYNCWIVLL